MKIMHALALREDRTINVIRSNKLLPMQPACKFKPGLEVKIFFDSIWHYGWIIKTENISINLSSNNKPLCEYSETKHFSSVSDYESLLSQTFVFIKLFYVDTLIFQQIV